jgi:threonine dehydrogenase-like Zn-dependent dehydrogenase
VVVAPRIDEAGSGGRGVVVEVSGAVAGVLGATVAADAGTVVLVVWSGGDETLPGFEALVTGPHPLRTRPVRDYPNR